MAHWDQQSGIPPGSLAILPLLLLPMAVTALLLLIWPDLRGGTAAIIFTSVALGWYFLGGAISLAHLVRRIAARRALIVVRSEARAAPEPIWICDTEGRVLFQNNPAVATFGDLTGQPILALVSRFRADADAEIAEMTRRVAYAASVEMQLASGDVIALSAAPHPVLQVWSFHAAGQHLPAVGADEMLSPKDADLFEAIAVALLKIGPDGIIRRANSAARNLLSMPPLSDTDEPLHISALLEGPGRPAGEWIAEAATGLVEPRSEMLRQRGGDQRTEAGAERHVQVTLSPDPTEAPGLIAVLNDASALKTLEAQFVQSQKMQAIGQLAGGVAHDFNNLLTAIRGHCDLLMLRHDKGDPDFSDLDQISQNTNRAAALVGQLLAFSRKQNLKLEMLDLRDTLADLTHLLNRLVGERVGLTIRNDSALRPIRADKRQLEQVIMNLVVNARDAMPEGGDIEVLTDNQHLDNPLSRGRVALPKGEYVRIRVCDEGHGISPELMDKIFEPFFTTKRTGEGTGLGLSTAYGIVKQMGGYIFCDSAPDTGTCFSIYFPAHPHAALSQVPQARPVPEPVTGDLRPEQGATVLLVEDEAPVRAFAVRALRLKGYEVHEADSAEAALQLLSDDRLRVDVFVTDVVMPGMDGPSWVRTALVDRPQTRVVFMSGYTDDIFAEGRPPVPGSAFLAKPFTLTELTQIVQQQLDTPGENKIH
ncbi:ATP-binding protein [Paracoccus caeni]|nr:ATP-binding protein [Paracoccus caeni]